MFGMPRGGIRYGAGRPGWKGKAEQCLPLDVRRLGTTDKLRNGYSGSFSWTDSCTGERVGCIGYAVQDGALVLSYAINGDPRNQCIPMVRTPCHFGGTRAWFICPVRGVSGRAVLDVAVSRAAAVNASRI